MLVIAFGDVHMKPDRAQRIPDIKEADFVVLTGDLTVWGWRTEARAVIEAVQGLNPNVYAQIGNMDRMQVDAMLTEKGINLHGQGVLKGELGIFGLGGSTPTPFGTPSEFSEEEMEKRVWQAFETVKEARFKVLFSHTPPIDTSLDIVRSGVHAGSHAVRSFLEKTDCNACICGHIHEAVGTVQVGSAIVINPGMLSKGGHVRIECGEQGFSASLRSC